MTDIKTETPEEAEAFSTMFTPADVMPKHIKPKWNGEGLPPVGCKVNGRFHYPSAGDGEWLITYISEQVGCFKLNDGKEYTFSTRDVFLTPIETPEQKAARERKEDIANMSIEMDLEAWFWELDNVRNEHRGEIRIHTKYKLSDLIEEVKEKLYDKGYRKPE